MSGDEGVPVPLDPAFAVSGSRVRPGGIKCRPAGGIVVDSLELRFSEDLQGGVVCTEPRGCVTLCRTDPSLPCPGSCSRL